MASSSINSYIVQANLGSRENPFLVDRAVGDFENSAIAHSHASSMLSSCQYVISWTLIENGKPTGYKIRTGPTSESGVEYVISIYAETIGDVEQALSEIQSRLDYSSGSDCSESGSYSFERFGEFAGDDE